MTAQDQLEMAKLVREIHGVVRAHVALQPKVEFGTVTSVIPLEVTMDGSDSGQPATRDASYQPVMGDQVYCHTVRNQTLIAGEIAH